MMDWLKPIEARIAAVRAFAPETEEMKALDMLAANCEKLIAAVRLAERKASVAKYALGSGSPKDARRYLASLLAHLRSGDLEENP